MAFSKLVLEAHVQLSPAAAAAVPLGSRAAGGRALPGRAGRSVPVQGDTREMPLLSWPWHLFVPTESQAKCASVCQHSSPLLTRLNARWDLQQIPAEALTNSVNIVFQGNWCSLSQLNGKRLTAQGTSLVSGLG